MGSTDKKKDFAERVIKYILGCNNRELGELTIEKICDALNISRSHLYEVFRDKKKMTPGKFLIMTKILRSTRILEETENRSIESIANDLGFSNCDYFIRVFKDHFGTTPGKYRIYVKQRKAF